MTIQARGGSFLEFYSCLFNGNVVVFHFLTLTAACKDGKVVCMAIFFTEMSNLFFKWKPLVEFVRWCVLVDEQALLSVHLSTMSGIDMNAQNILLVLLFFLESFFERFPFVFSAFPVLLVNFEYVFS